MLVFRWLLMILLFSGVVCLALAMITGQARWRVLGKKIIIWTVFAALGFFAVLILERMALWV